MMGKNERYIERGFSRKGRGGDVSGIKTRNIKIEKE